MKRLYVFDVDGTLTPARQRIEPGCETFFRNFAAIFPVYLVSGSDYGKIREQMPDDILESCAGVFGCSGAEFWKKGSLVYRKDHDFPRPLRTILEQFIDTSPYGTRRGNHIEERPGMLNISVVGRNASLEDRMHYYAWDKKSRERAGFVEQLNAMELPYEASAGGQISVDVVPKGWNKAVAMPEILKRHPDSAIHFFGDRMGEGGNDRPLALALEAKGAPHKAVAVSGYEDCFRHLREEMLLADTRAA